MNNIPSEGMRSLDQRSRVVKIRARQVLKNIKRKKQNFLGWKIFVTVYQFCSSYWNFIFRSKKIIIKKPIQAWNRKTAWLRTTTVFSSRLFCCIWQIKSITNKQTNKRALLYLQTSPRELSAPFVHHHCHWWPRLLDSCSDGSSTPRVSTDKWRVPFWSLNITRRIRLP